MDFSWLSLLLLSFVWTTALHIYEPASLIWILLLLAALLLAFFAARKEENASHLSACKSALTTIGLVLLAQGAAIPFYYIFAARVHAETFFTALAGFVLKLFGLGAVAEGSTLYLDGFVSTVVFSGTVEKAGLLYGVLFALGGTVLLLMKKARWKQYAVFFSVTFLYILLRYVFLIMLYATYGMHSLFWERILSLVTFVPYALILAVIFRSLPAPRAELRFRGFPRAKSWITGGLAVLLAFSGVSFFALHDFGREKPGRVLVDEYHSDWEWTTDTYDEQWFGERSGYNYYCFFNYLERYYETSRNMAAIDADTLRDVDVFIMKTPTKPFSPEEVAYMTSFVENGGGLYLIGDHTNVFGTGANLNQIAKTFGLRFHYDCTYELTAGNLSEYDAPRLLPHPVVSGLPHFLFATSNTLGATWTAEEIMIGYGLKCLPADYSQKNFFPAETNAATLEFGLFLQSAGVQYGKGRVLAFTDSTVFSNFWMFMPGKPELLLGSVEWLNRENTLPGVAPREIAAVALAVSLLLCGAWVAKNRRDFPLALFLSAGMAALLLFIGGYHAVNSAAARLPEPIRPMTDIRFEREYSQFALPGDLEGFTANMDVQLNTFYVWTQRIDCFPGVDDTLTEALAGGELAVMAKPARDIKSPQKILDEIEGGARLLILDHAASGAHSNPLLELAGLKLTGAATGQRAAFGAIENIPLTDNAAAILGGDVLIRDDLGNAIFSVVRIGDGLLAVFSDPDLFYSYELGDVSANLTEKTATLTSLEFAVLKSLLESEQTASVSTENINQPS